MPCQQKNVKFEAVWEEEENADYTVLFWTEKADYDKSKTELRDRYDYVGAKVIKGAKTGSHPDLTTISKEGIGFPDLEGRLEEVLKDEDRFAKFYFLNKDLTNKVNASEKDPAVVKEVSSTGKTVYNVYYDRRVYTLYFTKTVYDTNEDFFPDIKRNGTYIGGSKSPTGKAYSEKVRFGQDLSKIWPTDNQIEFPDDNGGVGWVINTNYDAEGTEWGIIFLDCPPYRLSAEDLIENPYVDGGGGFADEFNISKNQTKKRSEYEISLGIEYGETTYANGNVMPYHIDF